MNVCNYSFQNAILLRLVVCMSVPKLFEAVQCQSATNLRPLYVTHNLLRNDFNNTSKFYLYVHMRKITVIKALKPVRMVRNVEQPETFKKRKKNCIIQREVDKLELDFCNCLIFEITYFLSKVFAKFRGQIFIQNRFYEYN